MIVIIHGFFCNIFDKDKITLHSKKIQLSFAFLNLWMVFYFVCLKLDIFEMSLSKADHCDRLVVNKDNASPGGLQAGPQRISVF